MRSIVLIIAAVLAMGASAGPPPWLVDHVRNRINDGYDPKDPEGPPLRQPSPKMFKRVDVNGDDIPDWQVSYEGEIGWCGTGGCEMEVWVGRADGPPLLAWGTQVREFKLTPARKGQGAVVDVDFHGSACGGFGAIECPRRYVWDNAGPFFVPVVNSKGDGFIDSLPVSPVDLKPANAPADVQAQAWAMADLCREAGGKIEDTDYAVTRLPDLNGDGIPDWAIGSQYDVCENPQQNHLLPMALEIMVSGPDGRFDTAWGASEPKIAFDLSTSPVTMLQVDFDDTCGLDGSAGCPHRPFTWNPEIRRLVPPG